MKRFAGIILAVSLALGGCAQLKEIVDNGISNPVNTERVVAIKSGYGIALSGAVAYRDSCARRIIPPDCRLIVPKLVSANRKVEIALSRLDSIRKLGPNIDITEAVNALSDAVNDLKVLVPTGGQ